MAQHAAAVGREPRAEHHCQVHLLGPRDDPFFIDLEAAFCILPDRRPVTGPLSQPCTLAGGGAFRPAGQAQNYVNGFNVLSIVIELPESQLTAGGNPKIGIWGTISR